MLTEERDRNVEVVVRSLKDMEMWSRGSYQWRKKKKCCFFEYKARIRVLDSAVSESDKPVSHIESMRLKACI